MQLCIDSSVFQAALVFVGLAVSCLLLVLHRLLSLSQRSLQRIESQLGSDKDERKISRRAKNKRLSTEAFQSKDQCIHCNETCGGMKSYTAVTLCTRCFDVDK